MGRFLKRAARDPWQPDDSGVTSGGDAGGDEQAGDSYSVRFTRPDLPGSLITVSFYASKTGRREYGVTRQVEWLVCADPSDPGGTEIWSDYSYDEVSPVPVGSRAEAEALAREFAESALDDPTAYGGWDGQPDYGATG